MAVKRSSQATSKSAKSRPASARPAQRPVAKGHGVATKAKAPARAASKAPSKGRAPASSAAPAKTPRKVAGAAAKPAHAVARKTAKATKTRAQPTLRQVVLDALADMKAVDVKALDVRGITDITDTMVVASGTSDRHVKSIADRVVQRCKEAGFRPYGLEGERDGEWVLLDLNDLVLHVMLPRVREFYALEKLWEGSGAAAAARRA
ncbi:MAG TPA: ribosome silencing factor [Steroidobacteraceae bacterium]|nr:ribosome silencing factor [Steroidobacteraceae bacterium]